MPKTLPPLQRPSPPEPAPNRIRWTRTQCDAMREAHILVGRYELIGGEILSKMGQKPPRAYVVKAFLAWLAGLFGIETVQIQSTIDLSEVSPDYDEPEPDVAVTAQPYRFYPQRHPGPADLLLIIEVSDTTLRFDLTAKAALYSRAGIREYWVADIAGRRIIVHREPAPEGYRSVVAYAEAESLASLARPDAPVRVSDLLPPA